MKRNTLTKQNLRNKTYKKSQSQSQIECEEKQKKNTTTTITNKALVAYTLVTANFIIINIIFILASVALTKKYKNATTTNTKTISHAYVLECMKSPQHNTYATLLNYVFRTTTIATTTLQIYNSHLLLITVVQWRLYCWCCALN